MSQPPMVGPIAGAKVAVSPKMVMPIGCWCFGSRVRRMVMAVGISTPPVTPWPARKRMSCGSEVESAQRTEKTMNSAVLIYI